MEHVDLLVVGGGINGAGIARDAVGRGLSVMLVEKDDLAAHTSSASSKLIHGGLRYLEQFEFKLVRESLAERERLLRAAPHIVEPLRFVIPRSPFSRAAWKLRAGLFLYDHLGARKVLPPSRGVRLDELGDGLRPFLKKGFAYWDCRVQDSRLVVLNALDAAERGATIRTRTELVEARRADGKWLAKLSGSDERTVAASALVNAAGAWAGQLLDRIEDAPRGRPLRLVKGSHIVVPRLFVGDHAFLLQNPEGRVVFAIPFEGSFTIVGTTDIEWTGAAAEPTISDAETEYLLQTVSRYFTARVFRNDIVWSYSGLRALLDDGASDPSKVTRDFDLDLEASGVPLLNVFGGKITTYRLLAEEALKRLRPFFPGAGGAWTERAVLPGGEMPNLEEYAGKLSGSYRDLPSPLLARLARTYGIRAERLLGDARSVGDLGEKFGADLYALEVDYLMHHEWARSAEDVLWRRTKLGLRMTKAEVARVADYMAGSS
jgi:glycerol-3-phosphate dehydrogenase